MKSLPIFIFLFLLVLTPIISAQPPPQQNINTGVGLQVEFTDIDIRKNNVVQHFNNHVFNISTGLKVTNETTDCNFHLFDNEGLHVINQRPMEFDSLGIDWDVNISAGNFTRNGLYSFLVVCNSSSIGGFASNGFDITQDGLISTPFPQQFSIIALGIILIMFGLFKKRYRLLQHLGAMVVMVMGVLTLFPGYNNISHTSLFGLVLGTILIAIGFYFSIEDSFSREKQQERFDQPQGREEEDFFDE